MRVALIAPVYGPQAGVLGRHVYEVGRAVAAAGGTADVLLHAPARSLELGPLHEGLSVHAFRPRAGGTDFALSRELWSHLERHGAEFDLIHAHGYRALPALLPARGSRRPLVFSPYYSLVPSTRLRRVARHPYRQLARRAVASSSLATCTSRAEAAALRGAVPEIAGRIAIVPPWVDSVTIAAAEPLPSRRSVILALGPLEQGRRIDRVISTLPDLGETFELVVVGRGPERRALQMHADDLAVADRVRFVGEIKDHELHRWLRTATVVVAMADDALSGTPLLEAASAGAPVIASDIPAHVEVVGLIDPRAVTLLSSQASPLTLADAILEAQDERTAPAALTGVLTPEGAGTHLVDVYRGLIDGPETMTRRPRSVVAPRTS